MNMRYALVAIALVGCAGKPDDSSQASLAVSGPDEADFAAHVSPVFERRCGSLDCHGHPARGLRIYGKNGLRLANDQGLVPGTGPTTPDEIHASYASIVTLQAEKTNELLRKNPRTPSDVYDLSILAKPLALERHKGGASLHKGDAAEQCITSWFLGQTDVESCTNDGQK
jgi:hypothetical protein